MDFVENIAQLANRIERQKDHCATEEAAKTSFVLPFFKALGYDVFNPVEVQPEYVADVGVKKGEKVDYAISINDRIQILVECKPIGSRLELEHASQLFRYFSVTDAKFAILTDGIRYCFYTDVDAPNKMDSRPFLVFDFLDYRKGEVLHLTKFTKDSFDVDAIMSTAADMKYQRALINELKKEFADPSEEFTRMFASRVYDGRLRQAVTSKFSGFLKRAVSDCIRETVEHRFKDVMNSKDGGDVFADNDANCDGIETTPLEIEGYQIIRAILAEVLLPERVVLRDRKSYCGILLDDNDRKPIARLHFNNERRLRVQIFDEPNPPKVPIHNPVELFKFKLKILKAVAQHLRADVIKTRAIEDDAPEPSTTASEVKDANNAMPPEEVSKKVLSTP